MIQIAVAPGQIWQDDCYYLDRQTGECKRKYVLVLAVDGSGDSVTAVFTSKPHGLTEAPACSLGPPPCGLFCRCSGRCIQSAHVGGFQQPRYLGWFRSGHACIQWPDAAATANPAYRNFLRCVALCAAIRRHHYTAGPLDWRHCRYTQLPLSGEDLRQQGVEGGLGFGGGGLLGLDGLESFTLAKPTQRSVNKETGIIVPMLRVGLIQLWSAVTCHRYLSVSRLNSQRHIDSVQS